MNIVTDITKWLLVRKQLADKTIGFIPTMGHLHSGHISLCQRAKQENDITVASIFINPTQFNQTQDFVVYPRTLESDYALLSEQKVDYVFVPSVADIYADHYQVKVMETELSQILEGEHRPGHFNGMLTVVLKLLNLIQANRAYFGEKDYQQLLLIQKMAKALFLPVDIIACPTIRAEDGLALSSRNSRLSIELRAQAVAFPKILQQAENIGQAIEQLKQLNFKVDYVAEHWGRRLGAVWLDQVRLIDNISIDEV
ncbi:MAG: pantoate--beta-alanine ligase [Gammaproteobacteria bacterium]|nr:pantoate--beta-alanine ligase [Gammaproteobacteria bacterium]